MTRVKETWAICLSNWVYPDKVDSSACFGGQPTSTEWDICQIHGHFPLATHKFLNRKSCSFIFSPNSYDQGRTELEIFCRYNELSTPQFSHPYFPPFSAWWNLPCCCEHLMNDMWKYCFNSITWHEGESLLLPLCDQQWVRHQVGYKRRGRNGPYLPGTCSPGLGNQHTPKQNRDTKTYLLLQ